MSSSARSSSSSNSRTRPLRAEKSQEDAVLELAELVPSLSEVSLSPKCVAFEQSKGALVHRMDVRFQTIETEDVEREAEQHSQSFRREPLPPRAAAERETDPGSPMFRIDVAEGAGPEHLVGLTPANTPLNQLACVEKSMDLLDQLRCPGEIP